MRILRFLWKEFKLNLYLLICVKIFCFSYVNKYEKEGNLYIIYEVIIFLILILYVFRLVKRKENI